MINARQATKHLFTGRKQPVVLAASAIMSMLDNLDNFSFSGQFEDNLVNTLRHGVPFTAMD